MSAEAPKLMTVSLDIDDVMFDTAPPLISMYREAFPKSIVEVSHWNKISASNVADWDARDVKEAVERVNVLLNTPEFAERVKPIEGMDKVIAFLARRAALYAALTGRPEDLLAATLAMLESQHEGHFQPDVNLFFTNYSHDAKTIGPADKLAYVKKLGVTHHGDDHLNHGIPIAEAGIHVATFGHNSWNALDVDDMPPTMVRTGDADALLEYFTDEDRRLINGDPWDPKTARRFY